MELHDDLLHPASSRIHTGMKTSALKRGFQPLNTFSQWAGQTPAIWEYTMSGEQSRLHCPQTSVDLLTETSPGKAAQLAHQLSLSTGQLTYVVQLTRTKQLMHHIQLSLKSVHTTVCSRNSRIGHDSSASGKPHSITRQFTPTQLTSKLPSLIHVAQHPRCKYPSWCTQNSPKLKSVKAQIAKTPSFSMLSCYHQKQLGIVNTARKTHNSLFYHKSAYVDQLRSRTSAIAHGPQASAYCSAQDVLKSLRHPKLFAELPDHHASLEQLAIPDKLMLSSPKF
ncbi:hypothetical protein F511_33138 [Dorcoceras hygrometricum]|uniref:Uncharacterized protein n=1 Tax=Dorcoceras hygrometricum TaxID=472368 RepID=A0A2Z7C8B5_9LAMI|nr:hypothetical protein F511_33138 [Dorcoceras hygrometricum]